MTDPRDHRPDQHAFTDDAFLKFFDDAAVFPPGLTPLPQAAMEHVARQDDPRAKYTGPLVLGMVHVEQLLQKQYADLCQALDGVSIVVADDMVDSPLFNRALAELPVQSVEVRVECPDRIPAAVDAVRSRTTAAIFIELPWEALSDDAVASIASRGSLLKLRTGGLVAAAFPTAGILASAIACAARFDVAFKATAGLHRAVAHVSPSTGFPHHGFLNLAVAAARSLSGASRRAIEDGLRLSDGARMLQELSTTSWRQAFLSFGTCSVDEPLESLGALNITIAPAVEAGSA